MTELEDKSASDSEEEPAVSATSLDDIDMDSDEEVISYYCTITKGEFCAETDDFGDASNNLDYESYIFFSNCSCKKRSPPVSSSQALTRFRK